MVTLDKLRTDLPEICQRYRIAYVDAFGSLARNEQTDASDIDLIIEFTEPRQEAISHRFFGFLHAMEDRYQRRIDLLTENSLKNPYLRQEVNRERIRLYG